MSAATPASSALPQLPGSALNAPKGSLLAPAKLVLDSPPMRFSQATDSALATPSPGEPDGEVMYQDGSNRDNDDPWKFWTRV